MGSEPLLGLPVAPITDGESYEFHGPFLAGHRIPRGEADRVNGQSIRCTEFFEALEQTPDDIAAAVVLHGRQTVLPAAAFVVEVVRTKGRHTHHVRYAARARVPLLEVVALCKRIGNARLYVSIYAAKMKAFREGVEFGTA